jgi:hypothetical protein
VPEEDVGQGYCIASWSIVALVVIIISFVVVFVVVVALV